MRLINEDALIDALMQYTWRDEDGYEIHDAGEKRKYITEWLPSLPTIDVVPVVRCRDCKYFSTDNLFGGIEATICAISVLNHPLRNADDYCSRGERKD